MSASTRVKKGQSPKTLRALREIRWQREEVTKLLLDFGITMETDAIHEDWLIIVIRQCASVCDELLMDESDPEVRKSMRKKLVLLASTITAWTETFDEKEA